MSVQMVKRGSFSWPDTLNRGANKIEPLPPHYSYFWDDRTRQSERLDALVPLSGHTEPSTYPYLNTIRSISNDQNALALAFCNDRTQLSRTGRAGHSLAHTCAHAATPMTGRTGAHSDPALG
jgi:hypothetical protein